MNKEISEIKKLLRQGNQDTISGFCNCGFGRIYQERLVRHKNILLKSATGARHLIRVVVKHRQGCGGKFYYFRGPEQIRLEFTDVDNWTIHECSPRHNKMETSTIIVVFAIALMQST